MQIKNRSYGFTLAEFITVMLIIAVLIVVAIPFYHGTFAIVERRACQANVHIINNASIQYQHSKGSFPVSINQLVASGFLKAAPGCPSGGSYTYDSATGTAQCSLLEHQ